MAGLIGLLGAVVGASAAFSGVVYQQRRQADMTRRERRDALAEKAVDTLIQQLEKVRQLAWSLESDEGGTPPFERLEAFADHLATISLASLRLPAKELRESIQAAVAIGFGHERSFQEHIGLEPRALLIATMAREAQACLGAFLRQEAIPPRELLGRAEQYVTAMTTRP